MPSIYSLPASPDLLPFRIIRENFGNGSLLAQKRWLCVQLLLTEYLAAAGVPLKNFRAGAVDKFVPWGAGKLLLNGPDSSTFSGSCNASFT